MKLKKHFIKASLVLAPPIYALLTLKLNRQVSGTYIGDNQSSVSDLVSIAFLVTSIFIVVVCLLVSILSKDSEHKNNATIFAVSIIISVTFYAISPFIG